MKCFSPAIEGTVEIGENFTHLDLFYSFNVVGQGDLVCIGGAAAIVGFKNEYKCTLNPKGRDEDGDFAIQIEAKLTGCS